MIEDSLQSTVNSARMKLVNPSNEVFKRMYDELGSSEEQVQKDIKLLEAWYRTQEHLPQICYDVGIVKAILLRCKLSVERAKHVIDMHFSLKPQLPEFFTKRDPLSAEIQAQMDYFEIASLPRCTKDGSRIYISQLKNMDTSKLNANEVIKLLFMIADHRIAHFEDYALSEIYIVDLANLTMNHVAAVSIPQLKKAEVAFSKGYSARILSAHFINSPPIVEFLVPIFFGATRNKKLKARLRVHKTLDTLYDYVDKDLLPEDYGGKEGKLKDLWSDFRSELESYRDWFLEQDKICKVDESKRPGKSIDSNELFGMEGTFKQLAVD